MIDKEDKQKEEGITVTYLLIPGWRGWKLWRGQEENVNPENEG